MSRQGSQTGAPTPEVRQCGAAATQPESVPTNEVSMQPTHIGTKAEPLQTPPRQLVPAAVGMNEQAPPMQTPSVQATLSSHSEELAQRRVH